MHGEQETTQYPRIACTLIHALFLGIAAWICLGSDWAASGNPARRVILLLFGIILFLRMSLALFYLLMRRFDWSELGGVVLALFAYQVVFALLGAGQPGPIGASDAVAIALFLFGSYLNTASELQRKRFKQHPENNGILYTQGLFRYARHINYFGDTLWVLGWAMMTMNIWSVIIPLLLTAMFIFMFIPSLTQHLKQRYGEQYETWEKSTKAFIPFVY